MNRALLRVILALALAVGALGAESFAAEPWVNVTGNLANMASECGNLSFVSSVPGSDRLIAGVALKGLWTNSSGNTTWSRLGTGAGSDTILNRASWIVYDPVNPGIFWEAGIYNGQGIFKTTDNGDTFRRSGAISHNDYVSVDFADPNRQTLLAGGHEQSRTVYRSTDAGQTWTNIGGTLPANTKFSNYPLLINPQTYLVNAQGWGSGSTGTYRTTDGGASWQLVSTLGPSAPPLTTFNGTIYWPANGVLLKSTDTGVTWTQVGSDIRGIHPIELPDGRLAAVGLTTLIVSADGGATWSPLGDPLPFVPWGLVYSPQRKAFFIWYLDCGNVVPPNAIMRLDFDASPLAPTVPTGLRIIDGEN